MGKFTAEEARTQTNLVVAENAAEQEELLDENNIRHEMHRAFVKIRDACTAGASEVSLNFNNLISDGDFNIKKNRIKTRLQNLGYTVVTNVVSW